jgi:2'-5' RNA ligase
LTGGVQATTIALMETIRAFIALDLSLESRAVLAEVIETLSQQVPDRSVRWIPLENIHLTLRFLGNTPLTQLEAIYEQLDRTAAMHEPFALYLDELGCFPNERRPRIIWVGVKGDRDQAGALQRSIEQAIEPLGWEPEKRSFRPHLTIGRVKDEATRGGARIELPWGKGVAPAPIAVRAVHLYESQLTPSGSIYTIRHTSPLGSR